MRIKSLGERLFAYVNKTDTCWLYTGHIKQNGYGAMRKTQSMKYLLVHRVSYELFKGPIPEGLALDHLCRVRHCVNPDHLEAVTLAENVLRGSGQPARNARKTHCKYGHALSGYNLFVKREGFRVCRTCKNAYSSKWRKEKRSLIKEATDGMII